tara:strand:- start:1997 stop:2287 length:291 start_codon:yes stop_codon:yes gene_type:complete
MISKEAQVVLNKMLKDVRSFSPSEFGEVIERVDTEDNDWNGDAEIVRLNADTFGENVYIKVTSEEDSYGGGDYVTSIQFVQPKAEKVVVTGFEAID